MTVSGKDGLAAFIIKGKSFPTVRPSHVSHQIFRLNRIPDLSFAILAAPGNVLDEVKEQFVHTAVTIGCDYAILDAHDLARIFVGYGYLCPRDGERILRGRCTCGYTPGTRTSNILQQEALRNLAEAHALGQKAGAVILPTGAGKTHVAATDILQRSPRLCVYVAHSHEILEDAETEFLRLFPAEDIIRFQSTPNSPNLRRVNLVSIQSLSRNLKLFENLVVDYLVIDEFHHAAAKSYRKVIEALAPSFLLGLTATPFRGDRQDVLEICEGNRIITCEMREGIELGILSPYHYYGCFDNVDYSNIRHNGVRYDIRDLERALVVPERHLAIVNKWKEKADGKATIAFCCSHLHAERIASKFRNAGIPSATYLSKDGRLARSQLLENFRSGKIKVLCVVDVLNEGVDLPFVECLLFVRPTESKRIFFQQLGRGLRHHVGKEQCVAIDFIGNFRNAYKIAEYHGLDPTEEMKYDFGDTIFRNIKEKIDLPAGCKVEFDDRVIDVFGLQTLNPAYATRYNIDIRY
jgi:superfamily II DNA or RNA helicase